MTIKPGIGFNDIRFGMSRPQIRAAYGDPEVTEQSDEGEDETEAWYYRARGVSLHFDSDVAWRLTTIETTSRDARWDGLPVVGLTLRDLRKMLADKCVHWTEEDFTVEVSGLVSVRVLDMNFWIEGGAVDSVQWGVPTDEDDADVWP